MRQVGIAEARERAIRNLTLHVQAAERWVDSIEAFRTASPKQRAELVACYLYREGARWHGEDALD